MKILLANSTAYPVIGGVENSLRYIARELVKEGHEVKIFCFQFTSEEPLRMEYEGVEIIRYPCKSERWPHKQFSSRVAAAQRGITNVLVDFLPDAIWSRSAPVGLGIRRAGYDGPLLQIFPTNAWMNCKGTFLQTHGLPGLRRLMLVGLWPFAFIPSKRIESELSRCCQPVAFSKNMRDQLLKGFPTNAKKCQVIPPGVDSEVFSPTNGASFFDAIEEQYDISRHEAIVLYVGRLSCAKHIPLLMDAIATLNIKVKLLLVGNGSERERLEEYAYSLGIANRVIFAGSHSEMLPGFYAMSRVCVLPTTVESFGQVYLESLACGTPVVGFSGDGHRVLTATNEIIKDGETGGVVREINSSALGEKIDEILSLERSQYFKMSHQARIDACSRFTWGKFTEEALSLSVLV